MTYDQIGRDVGLFGDELQQFIAPLLAKVLEWTGNISYEVYLFHSIILVWLNYIFFGSSYFNYNNYRVISIIAFIFTLFISDLAYRFLEKKCFSFYGNVLIDKFELR